MKRFISILMLLIAVMCGIIPINNVQAEDIVTSFIYPVGPEGKLLDYHISQGFGTTYDDGYCSVSPYTQSASECSGTWRYGHDGIDISNYGCGSPVYAAGDGHVVHAQSTSGWGNQVRIRHLTSDGYRYTLYGHLQDITISDEQDVVQGQQIGTIGNGGVSTACHLHFGVLTEDISGNGYYYSNMPSTHLDPTDFISSHQSNCTDHSAYITTVDNHYGSLIGDPVGSVHFYDSGINSPDNSSDVCIQDINNTGSSSGTAGIFYDVLGGARQAYLVRSGFWSHYSSVCGGPNGNCNQNGVIDCGAPIGDEYSQGNTTARQDFQTCYLYWNGSTAQSHPYPHVAPGWFDDTQGWHGATSYAVAEAYARNGARNTVGEAITGVHHWDGVNSFPLLQRFDGGSYDDCAIMYSAETQSAYLVRTGFWQQYIDLGPETAGAPCEDEYVSGNGYSYQEFEHVLLEWNGQAVRAYHKDMPYCSSSRTLSSLIDADYDGWTIDEGDCNDLADHVNPAQPELRDNVDNDCDSLIDETFDLDGDGFSHDQGDCNEQTNGQAPNLPEVRDGIDNNCDGVVDNLVPRAMTSYATWATELGLTTSLVEPFSITGHTLGSYLDPDVPFNGFSLRTTLGYTGHIGAELAIQNMVCATETQRYEDPTAFILTLSEPSMGIAFDQYSIAAPLVVLGYRSNNYLESVQVPVPSSESSLQFVGVLFTKPMDTVVIRSTTPYDGICLDTVYLGVPPDDQYVFFDFDGNGDDDPCVRRETTLTCLYDGLYGTWNVPGEVVGTGEYLITRSGRTHYYDYQGADGITDYALIYGETWADQFLYWQTTIVARFGNQLQLDRNLDGAMDTYLYYGGGNAQDDYYLADLTGDHVADLITRTGNRFEVDTNTDGLTDFWFTYGDTSQDSQWYFADFDGDGQDGAVVVRGNVLHVCDTIVRNAGNTANWTMEYGRGM